MVADVNAKVSVNMPLESYVVLDIETSGLSISRDRIIGIEAILVEGGQISAEFRQLGNPGFPLLPETEEILLISGAELARKLSSSELVRRLMAFIGERICVVHGAQFEQRFLMAELGRLGKLSVPRLLCSLKLAKYVAPGLQSYSGDGIRKALQLDDWMTPSVRPDYALRTLMIFQCLEKLFSVKLSGRRPTLHDYEQISAFIQ
jgi:DNA polymerase III epsilon subunit-like protein